MNICNHRILFYLLLLKAFLFAEEPFLYYWRKPSFQNFGDHLSLKIVERIVNKEIAVYKKGTVVEKRLLAIGSILASAINGDTLWGTGMNAKCSLDQYQFSHLDVRAVRGPLTRQFLSDHFKIHAPPIYGDPALLFPYLFPEFTRASDPSIDVLIIPHYSEEFLFPKEVYKNVVYPTEPWNEVVQKILESRFVVSSSLHGIVIAEAYGIPARYLRITDHEPLFKYQDYYLGTSRPHFSYATSLMQALEMGGEPPIQCDLQALYNAFPFDLWPSVLKKEYTFSQKTQQPWTKFPPSILYPTDPTSSPTEEILPPENSFPTYDLEESPQEFILETKQIHIPGHPYAFNPSLVRFQGSLLLSFRTNDKTISPTKKFGLLFLDETLTPISEPMLLDIPFSHSTLLSMQQDPRLIVIGDTLYMVYNNIIDTFYNNKALKRMFVAELSFNGKTFICKDPEPILDFPKESDCRWEKNWVPFNYENTLLLSYSIFPHRVFAPIKNSPQCIPYSLSSATSPWSWGEVRGGTPALLDNDQYIGIFHSSEYLASQQSGNKKILHYFMGAYTFSRTPPFEITAISPRPLIAKGFYTPPAYKTWKPLLAVFPCGLIADDNYLWISYGRQDHEVWIAKIDKKALLESLIPL